MKVLTDNQTSRLWGFLEGKLYPKLREELTEMEWNLRHAGRLDEADIVGAILSCPCSAGRRLFPLRCTLHAEAWSDGHLAGSEREGW